MGAVRGEGMSRWLEQLDDAALTALLERRVGRMHRLPNSFDDLASLLSQVQSCSTALEALDRTAAQVVSVLADAGGRATVDRLTELLCGAEPDDDNRAVVEAALHRACEQALCWPLAGTDMWRACGGMGWAGRSVLGRMPTWAELLESSRLTELRTVLGILGLGGARSTSDAAAALAVALPRRLPALLAEAPAASLALLRSMALDHDDPAPDDPALGWLIDRGLVIEVHDYYGGKVNRFIAEEVGLALREGRTVDRFEREPELMAVEAEGSGADAATAGLRLVDDAGALLDLLQDMPVKALASGGLGVQVLRRLAKTTGHGADRVALLLQLLAAAGLISKGMQAGAVTSAGKAFAGLDEDEAYGALVGPQLDPRARLVPGEPVVSGLLGLTAVGTGATLREGAMASAGRGPEQDASLVAWLHWSAYRPGAVGARRRELARLVEVLGVLGLRSNGAPAPWLGRLLDETDPAVALDPDEVSAAAVFTAHLPAPQDEVVLQADGTAFVGGRAGAELRRLLDLLGDRESDHTWRLTASGVRDALDAGRTGPDLLAELEQRAARGVPGVLATLIQDAARAHGRMRVFSAQTVLQLDDAVLGVELVHDRRLKALGLVELAPGVVASPEPAVKVVAALRAAGHAPVGEGAGPSRAAAAASGPREARPRSAKVPAQMPHVAVWGYDPAKVVAALRSQPARSVTLHPPQPDPSYDAFLAEVTAEAARMRGEHVESRSDLALLMRRAPQLAGSEIALLLEALTQGDPIEIDYVDVRGRPTTRVLDELTDDGKLFVAWCRLRDDERAFDPAGILAVRPAD